MERIENGKIPVIDLSKPESRWPTIIVVMALLYNGKQAYKNLKIASSMAIELYKRARYTIKNDIRELKSNL